MTEVFQWITSVISEKYLIQVIFGVGVSRFPQVSGHFQQNDG